LDASAEAMHRDGREVSAPQADWIARAAGWAVEPRNEPRIAADPAAWLYAVQSLGLVDQAGVDEFDGEPSLRFAHQLWQEFFAGRGLRELPTWPVKARPDLSPPSLEPLDAVVARLGKQ
jgi:hypothetical protein